MESLWDIESNHAFGFWNNPSNTQKSRHKVSAHKNRFSIFSQTTHPKAMKFYRKVIDIYMYNILKYHGLIQPNVVFSMRDPYSSIDNTNSQTIIIFNIFSSRNILENIIKSFNSNFIINFHRNHTINLEICF